MKEHLRIFTRQSVKVSLPGWQLQGVCNTKKDFVSIGGGLEASPSLSLNHIQDLLAGVPVWVVSGVEGAGLVREIERFTNQVRIPLSDSRGPWL